MSAEAVARPVSIRHARFEAVRRRPALLLGAGLLLLLVAIAAGIAFGSVSLGFGDTLAVLGHRFIGWPGAVTWPQSTETIVLELRLPRVLGAMAVGAGLAVAGVTFQGLLRNPLADPYVLGTASGAALGAAVAVVVPVHVALLGLGFSNILAFTGALLAVTLVHRLSGGGRASMTTVLLTGYAVGSLLAAGLSMAMYLAGANLRQIFFYLLGSFATVSWEQVALGLPIVAVGTAVLLMRARSLNALLLGDEVAQNLGLNVARERTLLLAAAALVTAACVSLAGLIGFVGLVVPHVVRLVVGPNARLVLPLSAVYGAAFLVLADLVARVPGELPVGVITALVGAPFFLLLLRRFRSGYEL